MPESSIHFVFRAAQNQFHRGDENTIRITWKFGGEKQRKPVAMDDGYSVAVQIKYKKESDKEYLTYPEDGTKLPAEEVTVL